jgi:hypothetical protein
VAGRRARHDAEPQSRLERSGARSRPLDASGTSSLWRLWEKWTLAVLTLITSAAALSPFGEAACDERQHLRFARR